MSSTEELLDNLIVVKRDGKKVSFDGAKVALAIKKGFDSLNKTSGEEETVKKYNEKDINKVYVATLKEIEKQYQDK